MKDWVDFKRIKEEARFEPVLAHYGLEMTLKGKELVGRCPFHQETRPSFRVNVEKRVFHCFGCGAKGNLLDFVARKEAVSIKQAARLVETYLDMGPAEKTAPRGKQRPSRRAQEAAEAENAPGRAKEPPNEAPAADEIVAPRDAEGAGGVGNRPLTFSLKLDASHPYLAERGVDPELAQVFGVGYCSRGMMKGRVAIPIHDEAGNLVGYAGRWPGDPPEGEERYKLPPGFKKSLVLYNLHRVKGTEELVIVEGYWSVMRLRRLGVAAVALMGRDLSAHQEALLRSSGAKRLILLLDGDGPGREAAAAVLQRLARHFFVRVVELADGAQPDTIPEEDLRSLLGSP